MESKSEKKKEQVGLASVLLMLDIARDVSDFANRLSFKFTVGVILSYCGLGALWKYFFEAQASFISCWVPQHFTGESS